MTRADVVAIAVAAAGAVDVFGELLPKHLCLSIQHNPHKGVYETVAKWIENNEASGNEFAPEDRAEMLRTGEVWEISWCPDTPVGSCWVAAATLPRALELASENPRNS